jgi:hypothetical protein
MYRNPTKVLTKKQKRHQQAKKSPDQMTGAFGRRNNAQYNSTLVCVGR